MKGSSLETLPPTSSVIRGHLKRGAHLIKQVCDLLKNDQHTDDPLENGWVEQFGILLPNKYLKALPENVLITCLCQKTCESKICRCKAAEVKCTIYCHGKSISKQCKNTKNGCNEPKVVSNLKKAGKRGKNK